MWRRRGGRAVVVGDVGCGGRLEPSHPARLAASDGRDMVTSGTRFPHGLGGGVDLRGGGAPWPPMSARSGDESDPLAPSMFRCSDELSPSIHLQATGNDMDLFLQIFLHW